MVIICCGASIEIIADVVALRKYVEKRPVLRWVERTFLKFGRTTQSEREMQTPRYLVLLPISNNGSSVRPRCYTVRANERIGVSRGVRPRWSRDSLSGFTTTGDYRTRKIRDRRTDSTHRRRTTTPPRPYTDLIVFCFGTRKDPGRR